MIGRNFMKHVVKAHSSKMRSIVSNDVGLFSQFYPRTSTRDITSGTQNHENQEDEPITKPLRYADPKTDYAFKLLFKEPGNEDLLIGFLNSMLRKTGDEEITHVTVMDSENMRYCKEGRRPLLEVNCQDKSGHEHIVQIQKQVPCAGREEFFKGLQYILAGIFVDQALSQGLNPEELKPVDLLTISDSILFENKDNYWSHHMFINQVTGDQDIKDLNYFFIELPKVDTKKVPETEADEWLQLLTIGFQAAQSPEVKSPLVRKAYDVLDMHKWTPKECTAYKRQDSSLWMQFGI